MSETVTWNKWADFVNKKLTEIGGRIDYLASKMAWLTQVQCLREDFNNLRDELIDRLTLEPMRKHIIEVLKDEPKTQSQVIATIDNIHDVLTYHAYYKAWEQLTKDNTIIPISHGRGHPRTWKLSE